MRSDGSPTLVLIPTPLEARALERAGGIPAAGTRVELAGFGPVVAAARAAALLERLRPRRVLLVGIAGAYDLRRDPLGAARAFGSVAVDGLGAGEGPTRSGPLALGLPQWAGAPGPEGPPGAGDAPGAREERGVGASSPAAHDAGTAPEATDVRPPDELASPVEERLPLALPPGLDARVRRRELLTVCAAAEGDAMVAERRRRFPAASAEDMEAFAVAAACALAGVPCACVRGISNLAGDREVRGWRTSDALAAARGLALELLAADDWKTAAADR